MSLEPPNLDNLRFQKDLVDEARKRIRQYCPEWSDYNVSDPGITLIELFAWMTEMLVYRLNRVPEKNYIQFLEMLNFQRRPARSATTELTFWLSTTFDEENQQEVEVPPGHEVRSEEGASGEEEAIVFTTDSKLVITWPKLTHLLKIKGGTYEDYIGDLKLDDPDRYFKLFEGDTSEENAFYLGFDSSRSLCGHILRLSFTCEPTQATGIRRNAPPWTWECYTGNGEWRGVPLGSKGDEQDTTGGLNNPDGSLVLYLPLDAKPTNIGDFQGFWVRCRYERSHSNQYGYRESPQIKNITASTIGASVKGSHAQIAPREILGLSSGEPGQEFPLQQSRILKLVEGETLEVEEVVDGKPTPIPWTLVENFAHSDPFDRHFTVDWAAGKVRLGPAVRQPDGNVRQYGKVPDYGRQLTFGAYRYGGGARGNIPPYTLHTMTSSVAYIDRAANLAAAHNGRDWEDLEQVKLRAMRELQTQKTAVTARDFEQLVMDMEMDSASLPARVKCISPATAQQTTGGMKAGEIYLLMVPNAAKELQTGNLKIPWFEKETIQAVKKHVEQYCLLTTRVNVREPNYLGVSVKVIFTRNKYKSIDPDEAIRRVDHLLRNFLNPLVPFPDEPGLDVLLGKDWEGWPMGESLKKSRIVELVHRLPEVDKVICLEVSICRLDLSNDNKLMRHPLDEKEYPLAPDDMVFLLDDSIELANDLQS